jgi:hypothetical protein
MRIQSLIEGPCGVDQLAELLDIFATHRFRRPHG